MFRLFLVIFVSIFVNFSISFAQQQRMPLDQGWSFRRADEQKWFPAKVPGTVHTDLLGNGLIPDPFFGTNEKSLQWIENIDWVYKRNLNIPADAIDADALQLNFKGLDTYADIYLNGQKIYSANNMFIEHWIDVKPFVHIGDNELKVYFHSPIRHDMPNFVRDGWLYPAGNDQAQIPLSIYARKAPYHYGWDWGPRFVTSGIWLPVDLVITRKASLEDVYLQQKSLSEKVAIVDAQLLLNIMQAGEYEVRISSPAKKFASVSKRITCQPGKQEIDIPFNIKKPDRWWPNGLGKQVLYPVEVSVSYAHNVVDRQVKKIGLRTVEVVNKPDQWGESFFVKVNGVPVFMKGANYIPQDNFLPRVTDEQYQSIFRTMKDCHFNMVRVWGGGIYEKDIFYDLADETGILVWQDFMFACSLYPSDENFFENVRKEAVYNIRRLRNHPSLALWCGNNEIAVAIKNWGWKGSYAYTDRQWEDFLEGYDKLFKELLPQEVNKNDPGRFYFSSSPVSNWGKAEDFKVGDNHYWGVWHGMEWFEQLNVKVPRFMSEYGFQSFPGIETMPNFATEKDYDIYGNVMQAHQKSVTRGNAAINTYMLHYYKEPKDFPSFLYLNQVLQAEGIKVGMEAHRRNMPYCMGTLYWQLNDCWPAASWSSMDYTGRWKALQFFVKKAYDTTIVSNYIDKNILKSYIITDRLNTAKGKFTWMLKRFDGTVLKDTSLKVELKENSSLNVLDIAINDIENIASTSNVFIETTWKEEKGGIVRNVFYLKDPKDLNLQQPSVDVDIIAKGDQYILQVHSSGLAKNVYLQLPADKSAVFSDNYMDVLPGETLNIYLRSNLTLKQVKSNLIVMNLLDAYK